MLGIPVVLVTQTLGTVGRGLGGTACLVARVPSSSALDCFDVFNGIFLTVIGVVNRLLLNEHYGIFGAGFLKSVTSRLVNRMKYGYTW